MSLGLSHDSPLAIVGCGTIGASWAAYFLSRGLPVVVYHHGDQPEGDVLERIAAHFPSLGSPVREPRICHDLGEAVADSPLILECAPENVTLKRQLIAEIQAYAGSGAIIASNTSSLTHSDLTLGVASPDRVVIAHPYNPPHLVPLVEIFGVDDSICDAVKTFYASQGKSPVVLNKEMVGHLANRLSSALWREALYLLQEGVASVEDIDRAITDGPGLRWAINGPFLTYHLGGGSGGIRQYLANLGESQVYRWNSLGTPKVDDALMARIIEGVESAYGDDSIDEHFRRRDRQLTSLLKIRPPVD
ncbi:3-hydroxyacyl-CoA dehydrogenase [Halomonas campaniensis]|uniref:3-hydroxyacyl-CoA dehydrogenase n=1 Tax=Halomonas campaniensis TaxID=213554 RepID=A0A7W5K2X5_9GAMM|nr:3-hydroxyacyl-CoA dehydrogenase NAD-binding domain-containing protein [Halomonas campaniensis]MBB3330974.1 3-hydroxyacyl-CoA dehydrogenase [Halomonas campaniensis]